MRRNSVYYKKGIDMNVYKTAILSTIILITACQTEQAQPDSTEASRILNSLSTVESVKHPLSEQDEEKSLIAIECKDPRPTICTREYMPVCATKDTGVRCITEPCPSKETLSYSNSCAACADLDVESYTKGECS